MQRMERMEAATHGGRRGPRQPFPSTRDDGPVEAVFDGETTLARPLNRPAQVGDVVARKYRLVCTLGRGGMGRIFEADHLMLDTKVALKFMHPHLTRDPVSVGRFAREARAAATLKSPYAARIIDVDQLPSGELYIVMEYLEGTSLETVACGGRGIPVLDAITYVVQACEALSEAHERGIIHRDVKPANLFLTTGKSGEPMIKVLDFGLAKSTGSEHTSAGVLQALGTPQYMSPEQIRGAIAIDPRTDVWSIGATLYELLCGRRTFDASTAANVFAAVLSRRFIPVRTHRAEVPEALARIIDRCLAHDPAARFGSARELATALESVKHMMLTPPAPSAPSYHATLVSPGSGSGPWTEPPVTFSSLRPATMSVPDHHRTDEPTARQTIYAALAGPALVAMAASAIAVVLGMAARPAAPVPVRMATVTFLTAKSAGLSHGKAASAAEAPEPRARAHGAATRTKRHAR